MDIRRKKIINSSVSESVEKLLESARLEYPKSEGGRAKRYVQMAFELIKKNKIRLPKNLKNSFCKKCFQLWVPQETVSLWFDSNNNCLRIFCIDCGYKKRI
ncbi:MAG: hypothetical protein ACP5N9_06265 [Candidatus Bilamarchaeum sp.]|jgi:ribonuclease P protein subunit RPR2